MKADPIFDQYLVKDDDGEYAQASTFSFFGSPICLGLEPRKPVEGDVEMFVDLGATSQDHGEVCRIRTNPSIWPRAEG